MNHLMFSDRARLENLFKRWAMQNKVPADGFNLITWLSKKNLIDTEKAKALIAESAEVIL